MQNLNKELSSQFLDINSEKLNNLFPRNDHSKLNQRLFENLELILSNAAQQNANIVVSRENELTTRFTQANSRTATTIQQQDFKQWIHEYCNTTSMELWATFAIANQRILLTVRSANFPIDDPIDIDFKIDYPSDLAAKLRWAKQSIPEANTNENILNEIHNEFVHSFLIVEAGKCREHFLRNEKRVLSQITIINDDILNFAKDKMKNILKSSHREIFDHINKQFKHGLNGCIISKNNQLNQAYVMCMNLKIQKALDFIEVRIKEFIDCAALISYRQDILVK